MVYKKLSQHGRDFVKDIGALRSIFNLGSFDAELVLTIIYAMLEADNLEAKLATQIVEATDLIGLDGVLRAMERAKPALKAKTKTDKASAVDLQNWEPVSRSVH